MPRIRTSGILAAALLPLLACRTDGPPEDAANIVLVSIDTLRADRIGAYGHGAARTPELDALAREGTLFEQAVTPVPITLPAHGSMLTGLLPCAHGARDNMDYRLPEEATTVAETLRARGYATAGFVSSFVLDHRYGIAQGFETWYDDFGQASERPCQETNLAAQAWLRSDAARAPFFLFVHYYDPHRPYEPARPFRRGSSPSELYDGEVAQADQCLGNLVRLARETGGHDRTYVIVVSDHGEGLGDHGEPEHGNFLYDTTVRVPLIVAGPGVPAGRRVDGVVSLMDIPATLQEMAGAPDPAPGGSSLLATARGGGGSDQPVLIETLHPRLAHRYSQLVGLRWRSRKLIHAPEPELYDLERDPLEMTNLAGSSPELLASSTAELRARVAACAGDRLEAGRVAPSEEEREKLMALGYVGGGGATVPDDVLQLEGPDPKSRVDELRSFQDALDAMLHGRLEEATALLQRILERDAENPMARETLALAYLNSQRPRDAARELELARKEAPQSFDVAYSLAIAYTSLRRLDEAREVLLDLVARHPGRPRAHAKLAQVYHYLGDREAALTERRRVVELEPDSFEAHLNLGDALAVIGSLAEAGVEYERAQTIDPGSAAVRERLRRVRELASGGGAGP